MELLALLCHYYRLKGCLFLLLFSKLRPDQRYILSYNAYKVNWYRHVTEIWVPHDDIDSKVFWGMTQCCLVNRYVSVMSDRDTSHEILVITSNETRQFCVGSGNSVQKVSKYELKLNSWYFYLSKAYWVHIFKIHWATTQRKDLWRCFVSTWQLMLRYATHLHRWQHHNDGHHVHVIIWQ